MIGRVQLEIDLYTPEGAAALRAFLDAIHGPPKPVDDVIPPRVWDEPQTPFTYPSDMSPDPAPAPIGADEQSAGAIHTEAAGPGGEPTPEGDAAAPAGEEPDGHDASPATAGEASEASPAEPAPPPAAEAAVAEVGPDWDVLVARVLAGERNADVAGPAGVGGKALNVRVQNRLRALRRAQVTPEGEAVPRSPDELSLAAAAERSAQTGEPAPEPAAAAPDPEPEWEALVARVLAGERFADVARSAGVNGRALHCRAMHARRHAGPARQPSTALVPARPAGELVPDRRPPAQDQDIAQSRLDEMAEAERTKAVARSLYPEMHP